VSEGGKFVFSRPAPGERVPAPLAEYDVAFSFAAPDRDYVEASKAACDRLGLRVMYDPALGNDYWGKNSTGNGRDIHGRRTLFFVPFLAGTHFNRRVPRDVFAAAIAKAVERGGCHILPVIIGRAEIPPGHPPPHTGWLAAERYPPELLAQQLQWQVRTARQRPREVADIVADAMRHVDGH
jgi:hypothetical protein